MKRICRFVWLVVAVFLMSCSNSTSTVVQEQDSQEKELEMMLRFPQAEKKLVLGTTDSLSRTNERPQMQVVLDYPFAMGIHEVTCGEFNALMLAVTGLELDCPVDNIPATNLTYYDAVLYANALSKNRNVDTVYTYSSMIFDAERHCTNLEGFAFHPEAEGYRLPTEAEWVYVANRDWDADKGWTAENSGYHLHEVCTKSTSDTVICDMMGNAMEWVNDWLGAFRDTVVTNYVGASDGGSLGQRVVKGGSYRNTAPTLKTYSRGDVYTVTSSTKAEYVGFRLAYGKIPEALWMESSGKVVSSRIVPLSGAANIRSLTGTSRAKLAFRNDLTGNLAYLDYALGLAVTEIVDTLDVYHPEISPDGNRVAFCTGLEGVSGESEVYVRDLNAEGSNLVKLDVKSAAIPRWRVLAGGDTVLVYVTDAGNNKDESAFKSTSTWQVQFANGKFGKPKKLFDGAYHGGVNEDVSLAVTGARLLRARVDEKDTLWYGGEQACNVSLSRDSSQKTLFLDFGGKTGQSFVGEKYGTHERLLIADRKGELIRSVGAPAGYSFDHTEWVLGSSSLVVASLTNIQGAHDKMVLVNLADSSILNLVEGGELWHPCLWVKSVLVTESGEALDLDSAGVYYNEGVWYNALELRVKMENFWNRRSDVVALGLGSSRMMFGMYEKNVTAMNFLNMAYSAADMRGMHYLFTNYMLRHLPNLKVLVIEMSPDLLWYDRNTSWGPIIDGVPGFKYDENHDFWEEGVSDDFLDRVADCPKPQSALMHPYNLDDFQLPSRNWYGNDVFRDTMSLVVEDVNFKHNYALFKEIVQHAQERGLKIICFVAPQNPDYKLTGSFGVYGPRRSVAEQILSEVKSMDLIWMDENKMGNHDYTSSMAYNMDHLSAEGAAVLTSRLDSLLTTLK